MDITGMEERVSRILRNPTANGYKPGTFHYPYATVEVPAIDGGGFIHNLTVNGKPAAWYTTYRGQVAVIGADGGRTLHDMDGMTAKDATDWMAAFIR